MGQLMELTTDECLDLLRSHRTGRLALQCPPGLRIFTVNYALLDDQVVFRTLPYGIIANNVHDADVAFQIDHIDEEHELGWSVMVAGRCRRIEDHGEVRRVKSEWDPLPFAEGQRNLYFLIEWNELSGRQIGP